MAYADIPDFTVRLGRSLAAGAETDRAQAALDDASALIDSVTATVPDPVPAGIKAVVCSVALRLYGNPDQLTSETIGSYTWRVDGAGLFLTPYEERTVLRQSGSTTPAGLWTQELTRDGDDTYIWGYDQFGGDAILLTEGCADPNALA